MFAKVNKLWPNELKARSFKICKPATMYSSHWATNLLNADETKVTVSTQLYQFISLNNIASTQFYFAGQFGPRTPQRYRPPPF